MDLEDGTENYVNKLLEGLDEYQIRLLLALRFSPSFYGIRKGRS